MNTPFPVNIIAALEWILGCFRGFYCLMFLFVGFYDASHVNFRQTLSVIGIALIMGAITVSAFITGQSLRSGAVLAWKASWCFGALLMLVGVWAIYDPLYAKVHSADDYFGLIFGPFLILCALGGMVLLVLPETRRHVESSLHHDSEPQV
jgi:hypothetical protein